EPWFDSALLRPIDPALVRLHDRITDAFHRDGEVRDQGGDRADGGPHGQQHGADDADRQRDLHERAAIVVLDADAPHVAFAHQFLDLADDRFTGDLELLGEGAPLALPGLAPAPGAGLLAGFRARLAGG